MSGEYTFAASGDRLMPSIARCQAKRAADADCLAFAIGPRNCMLYDGLVLVFAAAKANGYLPQGDLLDGESPAQPTKRATISRDLHAEGKSCVDAVRADS